MKDTKPWMYARGDKYMSTNLIFLLMSLVVIIIIINLFQFGL